MNEKIIAEPFPWKEILDKAWDEFVRTHTAKIGDLTFVLVTDSGLPPGTIVMRSSLSEVRVTGLAVAEGSADSASSEARAGS